MKNKGRKHMSESMNCKGWLTHLTRRIESMSSNGSAGTFSKSKKFDKKKWSKRVRGYFKSQIKDIFE